MEEKTARSKKSVQTQSRILEAFLQLMLSKAFDKITVKELVASIGITRGTFYLYFNDTYELLQCIEDDLMARFNSTCLSAPTAPQQDRIPTDLGFYLSPPAAQQLWFAYCDDNRVALRSLLGPFGDAYFTVKLRGGLREFVGRMMDDDRMPNDAMRKHFVEIFVELHLLLVRQWLNPEDDFDLTTQRTMDILNTMRVGANYLYYYERRHSALEEPDEATEP